jgi:tRNA threonylcarbamoyladenosine biosynthesis protein TsaB
MGLILNIDTALTTASVSLAREGVPLMTLANDQSRDHAAWLHEAIQDLTQQNNITVRDLDAVGISNGPGSYTGLRIGLSAAKGICYSLRIPLLLISTLELMAVAALNRMRKEQSGPVDYLCPLIDARRMEVFFGLYDKTIQQIREPQATIITSNSFSDLLQSKKILFFGNGSTKLLNILSHENAIFNIVIIHDAGEMAALSENYYTHNQFADLAYAEPFYVKGFYSPAM